MDNLAEESESFPNGFSTITLDHPEGDMHVFLIAVVTDSNTDGGKAEEKKKIIIKLCGYLVWVLKNTRKMCKSMFY